MSELFFSYYLQTIEKIHHKIQKKMQNPIVGIDLGTTNSVVSILVDKLPQTLLVDGQKLLPSVVCLTGEGMLVGKVAKNMAILEPENTVASIKRKMGQDVTISIGNRQMRPEEISAVILQKIRQAVVAHYQLGADAPIKAVVTVPAYFTEEQREATKQAAEIAKFQVERIINEPTAAALAYGMSHLDETILAIYDLGGGTFDISIIESDAGLVEVRATTGNNQLGGDDFDSLLADKIWKDFLAANKLNNIKASRKEEARLTRIAEQTKIKLSTAESVDIQESFFFKINDTNYHLEQTITQAAFEALIRDKVVETVSLLKKAIEEADLTKADLEGIILVGGSSRIPLVSKLIEEQLKMKPTLIDLPDEAVSHGATVQGAIINKLDVDTVLVDITPHSLGVAVADDTTYSIDNIMKLMARQKAIEGGDTKADDDFQDDLGAAAIIPKNTPIPVRKSKRFSASSAFQKKYLIEVYQGEDERFHGNRIIGEAELAVKDPIEHGEVDVVFELDINGLLKLTAIEVSSKEEVKAAFQSSKGKKIRKSQLEPVEVLSTEVTENTLIKRAKSFLELPTTAEEDKEELQEMIDAYKEAEKAEAVDKLAELEDEILDLLYYLEKPTA